MAKSEWRQQALEIMAVADEAVVTDLMQGAIDLHVHSGPSTMDRKLDHLQEVEEAAAAGMAGVLFKDHHYSVAPMIPMLERLAGHLGVAMYGSHVLNNSTGGFNPDAVDFNVKSGARLIFMPTAHAANHIRSSFGKSRLASNVKLREPRMLSVVDEFGKLIDPVKQILDIIAEHDVILSSGHLHVSEIFLLFEEAQRRGVKKLLTNHPTYGLHMTYDNIAALAAMGVVIEQSACLFVDSRFNVYPPEELKRQVDAAGPAASSDRLGPRTGRQPEPGRGLPADDPAPSRAGLQRRRGPPYGARQPGAAGGPGDPGRDGGMTEIGRTPMQVSEGALTVGRDDPPRPAHRAFPATAGMTEAAGPTILQIEVTTPGCPMVRRGSARLALRAIPATAAVPA